MSVLYAESHRVRTRYVAHLTVLGAGLVAAALHSPSAATPKPAALVTYRPPAVTPAPTPTGEVHTMSGAHGPKPAAPRTATAARRPVASRQPAKPKPAPAVRRTTVRTSTAPTFQQA